MTSTSGHGDPGGEDPGGSGPGGSGPGGSGPGGSGPGGEGHGAGDLVLEGLSIGYQGGWRRPDTIILSGLALRAAAGRVTVLLGPNGSGKSTLLRSIAGLQRSLAGAVTLAGDSLAGLDPRARAARLAVVLTERFDPGLLRGGDVVALGRFPHQRRSGTLRPVDQRAVADALAAVHAEDLVEVLLARMSDGQRQRVMIARALAQEPALLLLDEPSAFLDAPARIELLAVLRRIAAERGIPVVASTHDVEAAVRMGQDGWLIGPGSRCTSGTVAALAASGAIGASFDTSAVTFEPGSGMFRMR
jgi:iron complex transport system ATP-binding protein